MRKQTAREKSAFRMARSFVKIVGKESIAIIFSAYLFYEMRNSRCERVEFIDSNRGLFTGNVNKVAKFTNRTVYLTTKPLISHNSKNF